MQYSTREAFIWHLDGKLPCCNSQVASWHRKGQKIPVLCIWNAAYPNCYPSTLSAMLELQAPTDFTYDIPKLLLPKRTLSHIRCAEGILSEHRASYRNTEHLIASKAINSYAFGLLLVHANFGQSCCSRSYWLASCTRRSGCKSARQAGLIRRSKRLNLVAGAGLTLLDRGGRPVNP